MARKTSELVASRSHTIEVGSMRPNRCLATAAPSWTDAIPASTSQTGETLRRATTGA
jgi:hypothetical protein